MGGGPASSMSASSSGFMTGFWAWSSVVSGFGFDCFGGANAAAVGDCCFLSVVSTAFDLDPSGIAADSLAAVFSLSTAAVGFVLSEEEPVFASEAVAALSLSVFVVPPFDPTLVSDACLDVSPAVADFPPLAPLAFTGLSEATGAGFVWADEVLFTGGTATDEELFADESFGAVAFGAAASAMTFFVP